MMAGSGLPREQEPTDEVLVRGVRAGDRRAFRQLYHRHARYVAATVYRLLGHDHELDDIVQDTFLDGLRHIEQLERPERARSWLCAIAVRHVQQRLRQRGLRRNLARAVTTRGDPERTPQAELHAALYTALDGVPPRARTPWILHHLLQHTLPEVAELCGTSLATAKRRIAAAQRRLQRRLGHG